MSSARCSWPISSAGYCYCGCWATRLYSPPPYHSYIIDRAAEMPGGRALELVGDHALAFFDRPRDAVRAALAAQEAVGDPWISDEHRCALKCGIHSGRLVSVQPGQLGSAAPYVIRLCETAEPGRSSSPTRPKRFWRRGSGFQLEDYRRADAPEAGPARSRVRPVYLTAASTLVSEVWSAGRHSTATGRSWTGTAGFAASVGRIFGEGEAGRLLHRYHELGRARGRWTTHVP